jgi:hypothetical protein
MMGLLIHKKPICYMQLFTALQHQEKERHNNIALLGMLLRY